MSKKSKALKRATSNLWVTDAKVIKPKKVKKDGKNEKTSIKEEI